VGNTSADAELGGNAERTGTRIHVRSSMASTLARTALSITVYGVNIWGDAVRDLLDPRLRGGVGRYEGGKGKHIRQKLEKTRISSS